MDHFIELGYLGLFTSAFLAATFLPLSSELVLAALLVNDFNPVNLLIIATLGNVLGSCVNYFLGFKVSQIENYQNWRAKQLDQKHGLAMLEKYGPVALLLSWVPVIGDPITFSAGIIRTRFSLFLVLVSLSKGLRYLAIIGLTEVIP